MWLLHSNFYSTLIVPGPNQARKRNKGYTNWKEVKQSLFIDNMNLYIDYIKESA